VVTTQFLVKFNGGDLEKSSLWATRREMTRLAAVEASTGTLVSHRYAGKSGALGGVNIHWPRTVVGNKSRKTVTG
jgi:hypothetical protein